MNDLLKVSYARVTVVVAGTLVALLGLCVLYGWFTHNLTLLHVRPGWVAMAFNTALGFLFCGLSLLFINTARSKLAVVGGIYCTAFGLLTIAEYAFKINAHIDELFMQSYTRAGVTNPARMAICTALNFTLAGTVFLICQKRPISQSRVRIVGTIGSAIFGLGVVALSGYFAGVTNAYTWGQFTRMAVHTASGFMVLGIGFFSYAWLCDQSMRKAWRMPDWMPALVAIAGATVSLCIWQVLIVNQRTQVGLIRKLQESNTSIQFQSLIGTQLLLTDGALVFGLGLSALLAGMVYLAQTAHRHASDVGSMNSTLGSLNEDLNHQVRERAQAEASLREATGELEYRVEQRTAELARANSDLEEALEAKKRSALWQRTFLRDVLSSVTEGRLTLCETIADLPEPITAIGQSISLTESDIRSVRHCAGQAAINAGLPDERAYDLLTAVGEAAMNAVAHGGGGDGTVYWEQSGAVQVWICDRGHGIDIENLHQATLRRGFTTAGSFGHGFWLMLKMIDKVWLLTGPTGTTVVLEQHRETADHFIDGMLGIAA